VEYQKRAAYAQAVATDAAAVLNAQKAQLAEAEAAVLQAKRDFERASSLYGEKAMTRADYEAAETRYSSATARRDLGVAQIAAQQARIQGAGAQQAEADVALSDTTLAAPFSGVILAKRVAHGSYAAPGAAAFVLADTRVAKVSFGVPDVGLSAFRHGEALTVLAEAVPGRQFRGTVTTIAPAADTASRMFPVQVTIPNADQVLKIGMVATVLVHGARPTPAPMIPLAAVVKSPVDARGYGVYTIESRDGVERVRLQPVTLGAVRRNSVVIAAGLTAGQRIVATGGLQLADGEAVRVVP
jgi:RND family efflux transporter MFP subunit